MLLKGEVIQGYGQDVAGGASIIKYSKPSSLSNNIGTILIGTRVNIVSTQKRDNRTWYKLDIDAWVIGVGNTGNTYVKILTNNIGQTTNIFRRFGPFVLANTNLKNPLTFTIKKLTKDARLGIGVNFGSSVFTRLRLTRNSPVETELLPEDEMKIGNYTESKKTLDTTTVIEGSTIKNFQILSEYKAVDAQVHLDKIKDNFNILKGSDVANLRKKFIDEFNRFKIDYPDFHLNKTFSHVFLTRPDLNIIQSPIVNKIELTEYDRDNIKLTNEVNRDPFYYHMYQTDRDLLLSLSKSLSQDHEFIPFLSNLASSFDISDEFIKTMEYGETFTGYKVQYGKNNIESKTAGTFNITYTDDKDLSVYKIHRIWTDYISKVFRGELTPKRKYMINKILDYACSLYYIVTAADGETILFWSKYYGLFPTNAPTSNLSWSKGSFVRAPEHSISYSYAVKEDFNPFALVEFNHNSIGGDLVYRKNYIPEIGGCGDSFARHPFIETLKDNKTLYKYKLRFRD